MQKLLTFFFEQKYKITVHVYAIYNDQSFNHTLTNDIVSFEQLGPGKQVFESLKFYCIQEMSG